MPINKPTKRILEICSQLGNDYKVTVIDLENVIYRKLNDNFDFEISGLDKNSKSINAVLYIWNTQNYNRIVETISDIKSVEALKSILKDKASYYSKLI